MKRPSTWQVMWWPVDQPIPEGWRIARQRRSHHSFWSVLIEKVSA